MKQHLLYSGTYIFVRYTVSSSVYFIIVIYDYAVADQRLSLNGHVVDMKSGPDLTSTTYLQLFHFFLRFFFPRKNMKALRGIYSLKHSSIPIKVIIHNEVEDEYHFFSVCPCCISLKDTYIYKINTINLNFNLTNYNQLLH